MGSKSGPMIGRGGAQDASSPVATFVATASPRDRNSRVHADEMKAPGAIAAAA